MGEAGKVNMGQFGMSHQEALASVTAQAAHAQAQMHLIHVGYGSPSAGLPLQQRPPPVSQEIVPKQEVEQKAVADQKPHSSHDTPNTRSGDGYNWRKYGQKQVKGNDSSRSYYRCTHANCPVKKKVERCSNGHVTEIVYKGQHNHEPPSKVKCPKESSVQSGSGGLSVCNEVGDLPGENLSGSNPSTPKKELGSVHATPEQASHCTVDCEGDTVVTADEDDGDEPDAKRRQVVQELGFLAISFAFRMMIKDNSISPCSAPPLKTVKEPKVVVQAASDPGSLSDGYRWRKYAMAVGLAAGSYYKCTHMGCPVRKHVEKNSGDGKSLMITYEGKHNHDQPTLKKRSDQPGSALVAVAVSTDGHSDTLEESAKEPPSTQHASDVESKLVKEKALELGGEKALESAETLLSIGLASKASEVDGGAKTQKVIQGPLFGEKHTAVSV
ncbi:hypothetical protein ACLOJK_002641 [Asimina triloba]